MEIVAVSDVGAIRASNEDAVLAAAFDAAPHPWGLSAVLLVADGVGGHEAGEVASGIARSRVEETLVTTAGASPAEVSEEELRRRIDETIEQINEEIYAYSPETMSRPATTVTLCLIRGSRYYIGHVGDTRAFLVRDDRIDQVTVDDTWVAAAIRSGAMTPEEAERSPFRNHLMKAVGIKPSIEASHYSGDLDRDDILAICSDGLSDYVTHQEIWHELRHSRSLEDACGILVRRAIDRGGHDNISLVASARAGREPRDPGRPIPAALQSPAKAERVTVLSDGAMNSPSADKTKSLRDTSIGGIAVPAGLLEGLDAGGGRRAGKPAPPTLSGVAAPKMLNGAPPDPGEAAGTAVDASSKPAQCARLPWRWPIIVIALAALAAAAICVSYMSGRHHPGSGKPKPTSYR